MVTRPHVIRVIDRPTTEGRERIATTDNVSSPLDIISGIVTFLVSALEVLLGLRFVLTLLGANRGNMFADLIYSLSNPFIAPFRGLFNVQTTFGVARFEFEVIIAMIVYALVGWLVVWLLQLPRRTVEV